MAMQQTEQSDVLSTVGMIADASGAAAWSSSDGNLRADRDAATCPYLRKGQMLEFIPDNMEVDRPYPFQLHQTWFFAIKREAGHVDFLAFK